MKKKVRYLLIVILALIIISLGGYTAWNQLDPVNTCAQCHEIEPTHAKWLESAHAEVRCVDCHGTALSGGFHSLKEKGGMVVAHLMESKRNADIVLTEAQMLEVVDRCAECHQAEHAGWLESGHAATYNDIFMNTEHNQMEKPYADCFRCHGMFYEGNIHTLMSLEGEEKDWYIKDKEQADLPSITCLTCHEIHTPNPVSKRRIPTDTTSLSDKATYTAIYMRAEKTHLRSDFLTPVTMMKGDSIIRSASDPVTLLCLQCHAPNTSHQIGSGDDRTTLGEFAGMSCINCHSAHSMRTPRMPLVHGEL
jgi:hypothetical protein